MDNNDKIDKSKSVFTFQDIVEQKDNNKSLDFRKNYRALDFWETSADYYCKSFEKVGHFQQNIGFILQSLEIMKPKSLLDVGCGFGRLLPFINDGMKESAPFPIVGIDFCQRMVEQSEKYLDNYPQKEKIKILMLDARALPYKDNEFECCMTDELFTHLKFNDAQKVANEMARVSSKYILSVERYVFDGEHPEPHVYSWDINKFFRWKVLQRKFISQGIVGTVLEKPTEKRSMGK